MRAGVNEKRAAASTAGGRLGPQFGASAQDGLSAGKPILSTDRRAARTYQVHHLFGYQTMGFASAQPILRSSGGLRSAFAFFSSSYRASQSINRAIESVGARNRP